MGSPFERLARDAKIYLILEGTSGIQRVVIARSISGEPIRRPRFWEGVADG